MSPETVSEIVTLAPFALSFIKTMIAAVESFFPPKSGPAKSAAVIQATQSMAAASGSVPVPNETLQGLIEQELPGVLQTLANPPAVVPVETANQMVSTAVSSATAGMVPVSTMQASVAAAVQKAVVPLQEQHAAVVSDLQTQHVSTIADLEAQLAAAKASVAAPVPEPSRTHGVTFMGGTPVLNSR